MKICRRSINSFSVWVLVLLHAVVAESSNEHLSLQEASTIQAEPIFDKTREQLFLEVFNQPLSTQPVSSYVLLVVNELTQTKVKALLPQVDQATILLDANQVIAILSAQRLILDILQDLEDQIDSKGWLDQQALVEAGIGTSYNPRNFELALTIDPSMLTTQIQYLSSPMVDPLTTNAIRPAPFSAFVNLDFKASTKHFEQGSNAMAEHRIGGVAKGAINLKGVVLESAFFGQIGSDNSLRRGDLRFVYDRPKQALRYTLGDLSYPVIGFQKLINIGGFGISKDFMLQPHVQAYRTQNFELYLEYPSTIKVWVNESLVNTLQLEAGAHDVRGFTPAIGQNNIRLVIEDNAGRKEVLTEAFIFNPILIAKGKSLFSYNTGFERTLENGAYTYETNKPVLSVSYLTGLTDEMMFGAYAQATSFNTLVGVKATRALSDSVFEVDLAASTSGNFEPGMGAKLAWNEMPKKQSPLKLQRKLSLEYLGAHFNERSSALMAQRHRLKFDSSVSINMANGLKAKIGGAYMSLHSQGLRDEYQINTALTRKWGPYTRVRALWRRYRLEQQAIQNEFSIGLFFNFRKDSNTFHLSKEMESNAIVARWEAGVSNTSTGAFGMGSSRVSAQQQQYQGAIGYTGNQGRIKVTHTQQEINQEGELSERAQQTDFQIQSTLVLADRTLALSRKVTNNFAIIKGQQGLKGINLKVDPSEGGYSRAASSWISPAVLVNMPNYRLEDIFVEPINAPLGATPEKMNFSLAPTYKSGFVLALGQSPKIVAVGKLTTLQQEPLVNQAIEIMRVGDPSAEVITGMTSKNGRFQMPNVQPGRYEIQPLPKTKWARITVIIPESQNGVCRLGEITVTEIQSVTLPF